MKISIFKKISLPFKKVLVSFLTFLFIITPVTPAFAKSNADSSSKVLLQATTSNSSQSSQAKTANSKSSITSGAASAAAFLAATTPKTNIVPKEKDNATTSPLISLGSQNSTSALPIAQNQYKIQPRVDSLSGAMVFDYPIDIPPGINGFQPDLKLSYNSQNTDDAGIFGRGWSLFGLPEISRLNKTGIDVLYGQDISNWNLSSSISGELVYTGINTFKAKSEDGSFMTYTYNSSNQSFTAIDKAGTTYVFGENSHSRVDDFTNSANVYRWEISSITDSNGNIISFSYSKNVGQIYPFAIDYGPYQVIFSQASRNDAIINYKPGFYSSTDEVVNGIQVKFLGNITKKYDFTYNSGDNGKRSLLHSVQISAYDSNNNLIAYPATTFNYTTSTAPNWVQSSNLTLPPNTNLTDGSSIATDVNGDGYTDILTAYQDASGTVYKYAYLNKGDGTWQLSPAYTPPDFFISKTTGLSYGWTAFDVNGDRLPDLVQSYKTDPNSVVRNTYLNTGSGWSLNATLEYRLPVTLIWNNSYGYLPNVANVSDTNGDGLLDLSVYRGYSQYGINTGTFLNNSGNTSGFRYAANNWNTSQNSIDTKTNYTDINGDGIDDAIYDNMGSCSNSGTYVGDGNGNWYMNSNNYNSPHSYCYGGFSSANSDWGGRVFDINSDGLPDLVYSTISSTGYVDHFTYLNTGNGWTANQQNFVLPQNIQFSSVSGGTIGGIIDLDGDGMPEIYSNGIVYANQNAKYTDLLSSITYPTGGTTSVTYKSPAQYKDVSGNLLNPKLPIIIQTVNTITTTDPVNNVSNTDIYTYAGGVFHYNSANLREKKFAGFGKISKTNSAGDTVISYYHTASGDNGTLGIYIDSYAEKIGKMYRQETYGPGSTTPYIVDIYHWDIHFTSYNASNFVFLASQLHEDINGQPDHKDAAISYTYDNTNGNLLTKTNYGRVISYTDGNFGDFGADGTSGGPSDTFTTTYNYASNTAKTIFKVSHLTITDASSNTIKESKYYYDNLSLGNISLGNQTKEEDLISGTNYAVTTKSYNGYGLVTQSKDADNNATNFYYDSYHLYPLTATNALSQSTQYTYNYAIGKVAQTTDVNGNIFNNTYDGLGRLVKTEQPDQTNPATLVAKTVYAYIDTPGAVSAQQTDYFDSSNAVNNYSYYDGLGRIIQTKKSAENNNFETKDYIYDNHGNLQKESLPYFTTTPNKTSPTSNAQLYAFYVYDALNRKISSTNAIGSATYTYQNWQTTITDANNKPKDYLYDAYNNLAQVKEHNLSEIYTTTYAYDGLNDLVSQTDANGNVRNYTYDGLGRKLAAEDLHNPTDSTFGTWHYIYDNAGNLLSTTDPKNQAINYGYDALNRKTGEDYTGTTGVDVIYIYDNCPYGIGRLCKTISSSETEQYEYSPLGNIAKDTKTINSANYVTQYDYDRQGNQILITNPDNSQVKNIYNNAGLIEKIQKRELGTSFADTVTNFDYSPTEQITVEQDANGNTTTNAYDVSKLYRLASKVSTNAAGVNLQNTSYVYDNVGNITQQTDASATDSKKIVNYVYDDLYRLLSATATNVATGQQAYTHTFTYDPIGNILTRTEAVGTAPIKTYTYNYAGNTGSSYADPDAVTSVSDGTSAITYTYDNNGNMTQESADPSLWQSTKVYTFDYNNRLVQTQINNPITTPVTAVIISQHSINLSTGSTFHLVSTITPSNASYKDVVWTSSNPSIATVDNTGLVTSVAPGSATITVTAKDTSNGILTDKASVTVSGGGGSGAATLSSIAITVPANKLSYIIGDTLDITGLVVSGTYSNGLTRIEYITPANITGFDSSTAGTKTLTITDSGSTTVYNITVSAANPTQKTITATSAGGDWNTAGTWTGGAIPTSIDDVIIPAGATVTVGSGIANCNSISLLGATGPVSQISISTGTLNVLGSVTASGVSSKIVFSGAGTLNIGGNFMAGIAGTFTAGNSTVNYNGTNAQDIGLYAYNKLVISNTGVKTLHGMAGFSVTGGMKVMPESHLVFGAPPPSAPIISTFTANPTTITSGDSTTLAWTLSGGTPTTLSIDNLVGSVLGSASTSVSPDTTTTYTITATNAGGTATKTVTVTVNPSVIDYFTASANGVTGKTVTITSGQVATLNWLVSHCYWNISMDNGIGYVGYTGPWNVAPSVTTTYTLTATAWLNNADCGYSQLLTTNTRSVTVIVGSQAMASAITSGAPTFSNIAIKALPTKLSYNIGDQLDITGLAVIGNYSDGTTETENVSADSITGFDSSVPGTETLTVAVKDKTITYKITINPAPIQSSGVESSETDSTTQATPQTTESQPSSDDSTISVPDQSSETTDSPASFNYLNFKPKVFGDISGGDAYLNDTNPITSDGQIITLGGQTGNQTITYTYDANGQRITLSNGATTTIYPTQYYNTDGTNITKHIFANGVDIATIQGSGANTTIYYNLPDALNSSSVMADSTGAIAETMDYYPYGSLRFDNQAGTLNEQRKYIGQQYDAATNLNYLNARYYNSTIDRFISEDPMLWGRQSLDDPQSMNSYSYARNNPISMTDPSGKYAELVFVACGPLGLGAHGYINIVPQEGANLSQYNFNGGNGSHYTIGGYPSNGWHGTLQTQINEPGNYYNLVPTSLSVQRLAVPHNMTPAQYDQKLLESGVALSQQNLGTYFGSGKPTSPYANSGNVWTQVILNSGGTVPPINDVYIGSSFPFVHFPYGSGHSIDTPWTVSSAIQTAGQAISYAGQVISEKASSISQSTLNEISATVSRIFSIINSL